MKFKYFSNHTYKSINHLDIGCGDRIKNPYSAPNLYGLDVHNNPSMIKNYTKANLILDKLPYPDNFFCSVSAYDVLEHIPRQMFINGEIEYPFINLMNEIFRVLKPNGIFFACTPFYPKSEAFVDPTHVNFIALGTVEYFIDGHPYGKMYGFNGFFRKIRLLKIQPQLMYKVYSNFFSMFFSWLKRRIKGKFTHLIWELQAIK